VFSSEEAAASFKLLAASEQRFCFTLPLAASHLKLN
jgi:hypothetical protein